MMTVSDTSVNQAKVGQTELAWRELLRETLQRGFHGTAAIEINVQDGTIQHIRRRVERIER